MTGWTTTAAGDRQKWWVLLSVGVGTFMSGLDASVVNALLPVMRQALGASVAGIQWVVTAYLLVVSGVLLGVGRLGDLRGHRDVYLAGFVGFVGASALCGLSPSVEWLVAARALQALGAAMLFANAPALLTRAFPPGERGRALGLQATMTYLGLSAGPFLGGLLAHHLGWSAVFFINVPVGILGVALAWRHIERDRPAAAPPPFDRAGAALFSAGLLGLLLALNQGHAWGWGTPPTLGLLAFAAAALAAFVALERRLAHPMLDLRLFERPAFSASVAGAMASYVANFAVIFLVPFYLIQARGLDPRQAGLVLTAQPLVMMLSSPVAGALSDRVGSRLPAALGMAVLALGLLLLAGELGGEGVPRLWEVYGTLGLCGLGIGAFTAPNNSRILGAAPRDRQGIASGVLAAARNVGMVMGVGMAGAVYTTVLARRGSHAVPRAVAAGLLAAAAVAVAAAVASSLGGEERATVTRSDRSR